MSKPADKPASQPKPANLRDKKRSQGRFREREMRRAGQVAKDLGGRLTCDPNTGIYTITFSDRDGGDHTDTDLLSNL